MRLQPPCKSEPARPAVAADDVAALHTGEGAGTGRRTWPRAALPALCITQITSWGVLYYAFPVLASAIDAQTGWSPTATTFAFSAALLTSAAVGIPVGRVLDHRGPRALMTAGSLLASGAVLAIAARGCSNSPSTSQGIDAQGSQRIDMRI